MVLIQQEEIVTGRPCGSVAQWSECSHGMRKVLGSSPGRAVCFFLPCDTYVEDPKMIQLSGYYFTWILLLESLHFLPLNDR